VQTYTHLAIGLVASQLLFPGDFVAQAVTVGATLAPDVPTAMWYALDKLQGKKPFRNIKERWVFHQAIDITHSLVTWLWLVFLPAYLMLPMIAGVYSHLWLDVISHNDKGTDPDPSWVWPLELISPKFWLRGLFDYRAIGGDNVGNLWTPLDIVLSLLSIFAAAVIYLT